MARPRVGNELRGCTAPHSPHLALQQLRQFWYCARTLMVLTVTRRSAGFFTNGSRPMAASPSHSCLCAASCRAHIASSPSSDTMASASRIAYLLRVGAQAQIHSEPAAVAQWAGVQLHGEGHGSGPGAPAEQQARAAQGRSAPAARAHRQAPRPTMCGGPCSALTAPPRPASAGPPKRPPAR